MPNNCLSVLYKRIIQVENKNVGLKVCVCGGGGAQTYHCPPPNQKSGGHMPPLPPPASYASVYNISRNIVSHASFDIKFLKDCIIRTNN